MTSTTPQHGSSRRSEGSESNRRDFAAGSTLYWHDCVPHDAGDGYWATTFSSPPCATSSRGSLGIRSPSPVEEHRRGRLAAKSITGLHTLVTTIRSKCNHPQAGTQKPQRLRSTSSFAGVSSHDTGNSPWSHLPLRQQSSQLKPDVRLDLSALVPDYLDDPPPYSSPVHERQEVIDWRAHFARTPILTRTISPHSSPAIERVVSPATSSGGAWDRVARRLNR